MFALLDEEGSLSTVQLTQLPVCVRCLYSLLFTGQTETNMHFTLMYVSLLHSVMVICRFQVNVVHIYQLSGPSPGFKIRLQTFIF